MEPLGEAEVTAPWGRLSEVTPTPSPSPGRAWAAPTAGPLQAAWLAAPWPGPAGAHSGLASPSLPVTQGSLSGRVTTPERSGRSVPPRTLDRSYESKRAGGARAVSEELGAGRGVGRGRPEGVTRSWAWASTLGEAPWCPEQQPTPQPQPPLSPQPKQATLPFLSRPLLPPELPSQLPPSWTLGGRPRCGSPRRTQGPWHSLGTPTQRTDADG